jgi:tetratricopeptide (TPR) repeat protein
MRDVEARSKTAEWRAEHYPSSKLHGPFLRPVLRDTTADPNDAIAYFKLGQSVRRTLPGLADRAFYWATRLDPTFSEAYFARWTLLRREFWWREMPDGSIRRIFAVQPQSAIATDSLLGTAIGYSPFLDGAIDVPNWIIRMGQSQAARDPATAGLRAYGLGDYKAATLEWGKAIRKEPKANFLHLPRAYAWVKLNEPDSAIGDLTQVVRQMEKIERDSALTPYYSKEFLYYAIGMLYSSRERFAEARTAYEQALLENLGFYMAHLRLAGSAAMLGDTITALTELQTALLIRPDDPLVLEYNGSLLLGAGRILEAEQQFRAALSADSDYALPRAFLGMTAEARHDTLTSRSKYLEYITRAPRRSAERAWATEHLKALAPR